MWMSSKTGTACVWWEFIYGVWRGCVRRTYASSSNGCFWIRTQESWGPIRGEQADSIFQSERAVLVAVTWPGLSAWAARCWSACRRPAPAGGDGTNTLTLTLGRNWQSENWDCSVNIIDPPSTVWQSEHWDCCTDNADTGAIYILRHCRVAMADNKSLTGD